MRSADDIYKLIKKLQVEPGADMDRKVHSRITKALEKWEKTKSAEAQPIFWRMIMKSKISKLTTAAVVIIAVLIGINQFGGSLDMAGVAWGEVVNKVEQIESFIFQQRISINGMPGGVNTNMEINTNVS